MINGLSPSVNQLCLYLETCPLPKYEKQEEASGPSAPPPQLHPWASIEMVYYFLQTKRDDERVFNGSVAKMLNQSGGGGGE